jgi:hypothetical protein
MLLVTGAGLTFAGPAAAKELTRVTLCGQGYDCVTIRDRERLRLVPMGGETSVPAPPRQPFYVMHLTIGHGEESDVLGVYFVPESNLIAANAAMPGQLVWLPIRDPRSAKLLRDAVQGIEPYPTLSAWPRELKSTYRVIPDDAVGVAQPSAPERDAPRGGRSEDARTSLVWLSAAIVLGLAALIALVSSARLRALPGRRLLHVHALRRLELE